MSWEAYKTEYLPCQCKMGRICVEHYADDWNRLDSRYTIECEFCKNEYHFETQSSYKPHHGSSTFLVKTVRARLFLYIPKALRNI